MTDIVIDGNWSHNWELWTTRWNLALEACKQKGGEAEPLITDSPATVAELAKVEESIGHELPSQLASVLTHCSKRVEVYWSLPDGLGYGSVKWDIDELSEIFEDYVWYRDNVVKENVIPSDAEPWQMAFPIMKVPNGDLIVLDLRTKTAGQVLYLQSIPSGSNGLVLGNSLVQFMNNWSELGCPGPEEWRLVPFMTSRTGGLDPNNKNALQWREWFFDSDRTDHIPWFLNSPVPKLKD